MKNKGFSLVELIVVIAIMAILVGVAVPVYSSYIEKTQKATDRTLVSEVEHALITYSVLHSGQGGYVILTPEGVVCEADEFGDAAMKEIFGDDWKNQISLKYDGWLADYAGGTDSVVNTLDTTKLTGTVTTLTNLANVVIQGNDNASASNIISSLFSDPEKGAKIQAELQQYENDENYDTIATNLLTKYLAEEMNNATVTFNDDGFPEQEGLGMAGQMAMMYAMLYTMSESDDPQSAQATEKLADFDEALEQIAQAESEDSAGTSVMAEIGLAFNKLIYEVDEDGDLVLDEDGAPIQNDFNEAFISYMQNGGETDWNGVVAAMGLVDSLSANFSDKDSLMTENFFETPVVINLIDAYQTAATKKGVLVYIDALGNCTVMPSNARAE